MTASGDGAPLAVAVGKAVGAFYLIGRREREPLARIGIRAGRRRLPMQFFAFAKPQPTEFIVSLVFSGS
jgi:hypothetical protein